MKKSIPICVAFAAIAILAFSPVRTNLSIGSSIPNPELKMKDVSGKEVSFKNSKRENGLLVMFSCNTCPVVIKNQDRTHDICKVALDKNVGVILLNSNEASRDDGESLSDMQAYAKQQGYKWNYAVDKNSVMADAFGAMRTPECFLFDKNLKLVYHGAIDDNPGNQSAVGRRHLEEAINEMLTGKTVTINTTRSVGCGIKRLIYDKLPE
ncbi:MAG: thioredoxin family protein [Chitinophagaceae bacterium]|nr:thioredoxin family protein [Chitinophagaceae bacterium]